jgi:hypothetical protein
MNGVIARAGIWMFLTVCVFSGVALAVLGVAGVIQEARMRRLPGPRTVANHERIHGRGVKP